MFADSVYSAFRSQYPECGTYLILDSLSSRNARQNKISIEQALNSSAIDAGGKSNSLESFFSSKFVLIDCWATWRQPCIEQIPATEALAKKYKNKVDIIYLSFDSDSVAWKKRSHGEMEKILMLQGGFTSNFAYFFDITSIPRYLLFSPEGRLINANVPRPTHAEAIDKILQNL